MIYELTCQNCGKPVDVVYRYCGIYCCRKCCPDKNNSKISLSDFTKVLEYAAIREKQKLMVKG